MKKMDYEVRLATEADLPGIFDLVKELAFYEKLPDEVATTVNDYEEHFKSGLFEAIVGLTMPEQKIVGMALYYPTFSTWKGKMMYLEDFVITQKHRKNGLGQLIFNKFLKISEQKGAKLVKWQVLDWNEPAIKFYEKNGATIEKDWYNGKLFF